MACRLFGTKSLPTPKLSYSQFIYRNTLMGSFNDNRNFLFEDIVFEIVPPKYFLRFAMFHLHMWWHHTLLIHLRSDTEKY